MRELKLPPELALPPHGACARLLRDPSGSASGPVSIATAERLAGGLLFTAGGRRQHFSAVTRCEDRLRLQGHGQPRQQPSDERWSWVGIPEGLAVATSVEADDPLPPCFLQAWRSLFVDADSQVIEVGTNHCALFEPFWQRAVAAVPVGRGVLLIVERLDAAGERTWQALESSLQSGRKPLRAGHLRASDPRAVVGFGAYRYAVAEAPGTWLVARKVPASSRARRSCRRPSTRSWRASETSLHPRSIRAREWPR